MAHGLGIDFVAESSVISISSPRITPSSVDSCDGDDSQEVSASSDASPLSLASLELGGPPATGPKQPQESLKNRQHLRHVSVPNPPSSRYQVRVEHVDSDAPNMATYLQPPVQTSNLPAHLHPFIPTRFTSSSNLMVQQPDALNTYPDSSDAASALLMQRSSSSGPRLQASRLVRPTQSLGNLHHGYAGMGMTSLILDSTGPPSLDVLRAQHIALHGTPLHKVPTTTPSPSSVGPSPVPPVSPSRLPAFLQNRQAAAAAVIEQVSAPAQVVASNFTKPTGVCEQRGTPASRLMRPPSTLGRPLSMVELSTLYQTQQVDNTPTEPIIESTTSNIPSRHDKAPPKHALQHDNDRVTRKRGRSVTDNGSLLRSTTLLSANGSSQRRSRDLSRLLAPSTVPEHNTLRNTSASNEASHAPDVMFEGARPASKARLEIDLRLESSMLVEGGQLSGRLDVKVLEPERGNGNVWLCMPKIRVVGFEELASTSEKHVFYYQASAENDLSKDVQSSTCVPFVAGEADNEGFREGCIGTHVFAFQMRLDMDRGAKGGWKGKQGAVRYIVVASINLKSKTGQARSIAHFYRHVEVYPYYNPLTVLRSAMNPIQQSTAKGLFLGGKGKVRLSAKLHRPIWIAGQRLYVDIEVVNGASKKIKALGLSLTRLTCIYKGTTTSTSDFQDVRAITEITGESQKLQSQTTRKKVAESVVEMGKRGQRGVVTAKGLWTGVDPGETVNFAHFIVVPPECLTILRSQFLEITYHLKVSVGSSLSSDISVEIPVQIANFISLDPPPGHSTCVDQLAQGAGDLFSVKGRNDKLPISPTDESASDLQGPLAETSESDRAGQRQLQRHSFPQRSQSFEEINTIIARSPDTRQETDLDLTEADGDSMSNIICSSDAESEDSAEDEGTPHHATATYLPGRKTQLGTNAVVKPVLDAKHGDFEEGSRVERKKPIIPMNSRPVSSRNLSISGSIADSISERDDVKAHRREFFNDVSGLAKHTNTCMQLDHQPEVATLHQSRVEIRVPEIVEPPKSSDSPYRTLSTSRNHESSPPELISDSTESPASSDQLSTPEIATDSPGIISHYGSILGGTTPSESIQSPACDENLNMPFSQVSNDMQQGVKAYQQMHASTLPPPTCSTTKITLPSVRSKIEALESRQHALRSFASTGDLASHTLRIGRQPSSYHVKRLRHDSMSSSSVASSNWNHNSPAALPNTGTLSSLRRLTRTESLASFNAPIFRQS